MSPRLRFLMQPVVDTGVGTGNIFFVIMIVIAQAALVRRFPCWVLFAVFRPEFYLKPHRVCRVTCNHCGAFQVLLSVLARGVGTLCKRGS